MMLACKDISTVLAVSTPGTIVDATLLSPGNAPLLVNSVASDFACALSNYVLAGAAVGEEVAWGDLNTYDFDRRTFTEVGGAYATASCTSGTGGVNTPLSTARWSADNAHRILSGFTDQEVANRGRLLAQTSAYAGYSLVLLGEGMCAASVDVGRKLSRAELWALAEQRFTTAIDEATASGDATTLSMARLGRARARINLSSTTPAKAGEAAADAALVPDGFVVNANYAATDRRGANMIFYWLNEQIRGAVDTPYWNLTVNGVPDPRVALNYTGRKAQDGVTPLVTPKKYTGRESPIPIARWAEAQLILAEARGGQEAVNIINVLRTRAGLPPFASNDAAAIRNQVIEERRRELFLEGHHLGDKIRFGLPFVPAAGRPYKGGLTYGTMTCFPYPDVERLNNPSSGG